MVLMINFNFLKHAAKREKQYAKEKRKKKNKTIH